MCEGRRESGSSASAVGDGDRRGVRIDVEATRVDLLIGHFSRQFRDLGLLLGHVAGEEQGGVCVDSDRFGKSPHWCLRRYCWHPTFGPMFLRKYIPKNMDPNKKASNPNKRIRSFIIETFLRQYRRYIFPVRVRN